MDSSIAQIKLRVLSHVSEVVGHALDLSKTLERILEILSQELAMKRATITLKRGDAPELAILASHRMTPEEQRRGVYRLNEGITGKIFSTARPFVVPDVSKEPQFLNKTGTRAFEKDGLAFLGVPIVLHNETVGVLSVDRLFDHSVSFEEDLQFLTVLGTLIAQLISLNDQVEARERVLLRANTSLKRELSTKCEGFFRMGHSAAMAQIHQIIRKVASTDATVLLLGESGTGKTLVAQIIHELSSRARSPFVLVNSAALPDNLLESEIFGHDKGAFTGADQTKIGRVEEADGGTVFLDEIGELSQNIQAKFLRFIQDLKFERLGSTKTRTVDVRIVAATNRNLEDAVQEGSFREDLFYRLNVIPIRLPALRDRIEDLESLTEFFKRKFSRKYQCRLEIMPEAEEALKQYDWPGNIRELENLIERLAILQGNEPIRALHFRPYMRPVGPREPAGEARPATLPRKSQGHSLHDLEKDRLIQALERNNWVQSRAAKELGITMRQIGYKIKKHALEELVRTGRESR